MLPSPVDTHAHVFARGLPLSPRRRYAPVYDAPLADFRAVLDRHGVDEAVLVQPSFLGTDNRHMLAALRSAGDRLRGIAVVAPDVTEDEFDRLAGAGVVGIRFNLIGDDPGKLAAPEWHRLSRRAAARGWQIELHAEGRDLPALIDLLAPLGTPLVVDHFGRPDAGRGIDDAGFRRLCAAGPQGPVWVKVTGAYRCGGADVRPYARALLGALGPGRLLWGSDWPFTQFEDRRRYGDGISELQSWFSESARAAITETSRRLFRFT